MDLAQLSPEAVAIGGLIHLHLRMNRVENDLAAIGHKLHIEPMRCKASKKHGTLTLWCLPLAVALALSALTGCSTLENLTPQQKAAGKAVARIALQLAIGELNGRVKELQPFTPNLTKLLDLTFAKPLTPEEAAARLKAHVADTIPAAHQAEVLTSMRHALIRQAPPASGPEPPDFSARLARAL